MTASMFGKPPMSDTANAQSTGCKHCGSANLLTRKNSIHVELYCGDCGKHQKFVSQFVDDGEPASDAQRRYAINLLKNFKASGGVMTKSQAGGIIRLFQKYSQRSGAAS
jgi:hypothetical protein